MPYRASQEVVPAACDVTSKITLHVLNGTISEFAIPCNYLVPNELTGENDLVPIELTTEGYSNPVVVFDVTPTGLTAESWIDPVDEHIVRLVISAQCPSAVTRNIACTMALLTTRTVTGKGHRTDAIVRGPLLIEAGPYIEGAHILPE